MPPKPAAPISTPAQTVRVEYNYSTKINPPSAIGMSNESSMDDIGKNIAGIISYIRMLVAGGGEASTVSGPMGPKFFVETPTTCKDADTGSTKKRSMYVNYVPVGSIPIPISGIPDIGTGYQGLLPGILENVGKLNPVKMMKNIMNGQDNSCRLLKMETIDADNRKSSGQGFVSDNDILGMDSSWFSSAFPRPQIPPKENFENYGSVPDASFMGANSSCRNIYVNLLGLMGIYIMLKFMLEGRIH